MIEAIAVQMRVAFRRAFGRNPSLADLQRLVRLARRDLEVLGPRPSGSGIVATYNLTRAEARKFQTRMLRQTVRNAIQNVPHYRELLSPGLDRGLTIEQYVENVPYTVKEDLRRRPIEFLNRRRTDAFLHLSTSGTTGSPLSMYLSHYEIEAWAAGMAIAALTTGNFTSRDINQMNVGSGARADWYVIQRAASLLGATCVPQGIVPPLEALASLAQLRRVPGHADRVTVLNTETTYAMELVTAAREAGMDPSLFGLRTVTGGGEVGCPRYVKEIRSFFNGCWYEEGYSGTEILPLQAVSCRNGFYHCDETVALVELVDPGTGAQLEEVGARGVLVVTPFYPWRHCTPVLRYYTGDLAERVDCNCGVTRNGGVLRVLGREVYAVNRAGRLYTQSDFISVAAEVPGVRLPVRYWAEETPRGVAFDVQAEQGRDLGEVEAAVRTALEGTGLRVAAVTAHAGASFRHVPQRWERYLRPEQYGG